MTSARSLDRIRVGISTCLLGEKVRFDGGHKLDQYAVGVLGRYVESQLYGIASGDLATLAVSACVLLAVAIASSWLPARRASRVDPMLALRCD